MIRKLLAKFSEVSTTPGDQPDWIGRKLESLGQWLSKDEPTVLEKAFDFPLNQLDKVWRKVFKKNCEPCKKDCAPIPLPTFPK